MTLHEDLIEGRADFKSDKKSGMWHTGYSDGINGLRNQFYMSDDYIAGFKLGRQVLGIRVQYVKMNTINSSRCVS